MATIRFAGLLLAAFPLFAIAAAPQAIPASAARASREDQQLDEIIVKGTSLWQLRKTMNELEDRFFSLYNELNVVTEFNVNCEMKAPLGTRIKQHACMPVYMEKSYEEQASMVLDGIPALPPGSIEIARAEEFRSNLRKVMALDPRLRQMSRQRGELEVRYNSVLRRRQQQFLDHFKLQ
ncbi:MAG: hypothetical protein WDO12_10585 [Pseudomonadota bacterium]